MNKNVAVVGAGYWGRNLVRNFAELGSLAVLCDSDPQKLMEFQKSNPGLKAVSSFSDVLADQAVEAVVIATPAELHFPLAREALTAGKDVFVEKPLALTYRDGEALVNLASQKARILMVGHILEFHPAVLKLHEMVRKGELGKVQYIYSNRLNLGKVRTEENILWSFAPHDISVILRLLGEDPAEVSAHGASYISSGVADVTMTTLSFPSGVRSHIFVSWLHPYKEQRLVVVGDRKMAVFDDTVQKDKLAVYPHRIEWIERVPVARKEIAEPVAVDTGEPLRLECEHFLKCVSQRSRPLTDGESGLRVLRVLEACQASMSENGRSVKLGDVKARPFFAHETAVIDEPSEIGEGTKIWHFTHVMKNCKIGKNCNLGQNVVISPDVVLGNNVKVQNNVSIYTGCILEDDVFCGPAMVFTNVTNPRSHWPRRDEYKRTLVKKGASIGANATVICGHTLGRYSFVGAGSVVSQDVPDYALVYGNPARLRGWMCFCGAKLPVSASVESTEQGACEACGRIYRKDGIKVEQIGQNTP